MYIGIGVGVLVLLVIAVYFFLYDGRTPVQMMEEEDGQDPLKRWARGCYTMVIGRHDPGTFKNAAWMLENSWEIKNRDEVMETLDELRAEPVEDPAWDLVRVIMVARMGAGAKYITDDECWQAIESVRGPLQQQFDSWESMATAYAKGRAEAGFDNEQLSDNREDAEAIWKLVPFR